MPKYENIQELPGKLNARKTMKRNSIISCLQDTTIKTDAEVECRPVSIKKEYMFSVAYFIIRNVSTRGKNDTKEKLEIIFHKNSRQRDAVIQSANYLCILAPHALSVFGRNERLDFMETLACLSFMGNIEDSLIKLVMSIHVSSHLQKKII